MQLENIYWSVYSSNKDEGHQLDQGCVSQKHTDCHCQLIYLEPCSCDASVSQNHGSNDQSKDVGN